MDSFRISEWLARQPSPADDSSSADRSSAPLAQFSASLLRRREVAFERLPSGFVHIRVLPGSRFAPEQPGEGTEGQR